MTALLGLTCATALPQSVFLRTNQLGFLRNDPKRGVLLSRENLSGKSFEVVRIPSDSAVYRAAVGPGEGRYGKFAYSYPVEFSAVADPGLYRLRIQGENSYPFAVGDTLYNRLVDSLMLFFRVQRCGDTSPLLRATSMTRHLWSPASSPADPTRTRPRTQPADGMTRETTSNS
jgi:endoglucanase